MGRYLKNRLNKDSSKQSLLKAIFKHTSVLSIYITIIISSVFIFFILSYTKLIGRVDLFSKVITSSNLIYLGVLISIFLVSYLVLIFTTSIMFILTKDLFPEFGNYKKTAFHLPIICIVIIALLTTFYLFFTSHFKLEPDYISTLIKIITFLIIPTLVILTSYFLIKKNNKGNSFKLKIISKKMSGLILCCYFSVIISYLQIIITTELLRVSLLKYDHSNKNLSYAIIFYSLVAVLNLLTIYIWSLPKDKKNRKENLIFKLVFTAFFMPIILSFIINFINPSLMRLALQGIRTTIGINDLTVRNYSIPIDNHPKNDYTNNGWRMSISSDKKFYLVHGVILLSVGERSLLCPKDVKEKFEKTLNSTSVDVERTTEYKKFTDSTQQCHLIANSDLR